MLMGAMAFFASNPQQFDKQRASATTSLSLCDVAAAELKEFAAKIISSRAWFGWKAVRGSTRARPCDVLGRGTASWAATQQLVARSAEDLAVA